MVSAILTHTQGAGVLCRAGAAEGGNLGGHSRVLPDAPTSTDFGAALLYTSIPRFCSVSYNLPMSSAVSVLICPWAHAMSIALLRNYKMFVI